MLQKNPYHCLSFVKPQDHNVDIDYRSKTKTVKLGAELESISRIAPPFPSQRRRKSVLHVSRAF